LMSRRRQRGVDNSSRPYIALNNRHTTNHFITWEDRTLTSSVAIDRLMNVAPLGSPDTITASVVATASGQQYQPMPGEGFRTDSVRVQLLFAAWGSEPRPVLATIRLSVP
jgi:hypothetical protein